MDDLSEVSESDLRSVFERERYVAGDDVVTTALLALRLGKPLLVEGEPGAGKTELAKVLARGFDTDLVRLQCYEGLAAEEALYEWNYTKQLLDAQTGAESVFEEEYLLERPLLRALRSDGDRPPVLLVDEVDRADEAFEALLLEVLSDFQVSIPELGTVQADTPPVVVLTSNRTREVSDALKRRCLYLNLEPPSAARQREILERKVPELDSGVAADLCGVVQELRERPLRKPPGVAETLEWAEAFSVLGRDTVTAESVRETLSCVLKDADDVERFDDDALRDVLAAAGVNTGA
ncbi:AAA family ATPase [Salarchaeum japonicum]|uniref:MoxR family ATPase n=1 Tax=Salarchaeum japonicum TaxID=555573 RepID=A0AAV3T4T0_9EURY|nr:MoxR family ATPase [Salarchaeum japonicum]